MNTLNREIMDEIVDVLKTVQHNSAVNSVVLISGKPGCFIAGADITMIQRFKTSEDGYKISSDGQKVLETIEKSQKPVVAAIQGSCLGGGLEVYNLICLYTTILQYLWF